MDHLEACGLSTPWAVPAGQSREETGQRQEWLVRNRPPSYVTIAGHSAQHLRHRRHLSSAASPPSVVVVGSGRIATTVPPELCSIAGGTSVGVLEIDPIET